MRPAERSALVKGLNGFHRAVEHTTPGRTPAGDRPVESA